MESIWPDLNEIIVFGSVSAYQVFGFATIVLAILNIIFYMIAASMMWKTSHHITQTLKNKFMVEALLALTTLAMGIGAFVDAPYWFWQLSYVCRVGLLLIAPFVLYHVIIACKTIINAK